MWISTSLDGKSVWNEAMSIIILDREKTACIECRRHFYAVYRHRTFW